ncbi:MAG: hypothetical protein AABZ23_00680 [Deltaproteobacteria bacterium]|mgnify:CR=1 FL=1
MYKIKIEGLEELQAEVGSLIKDRIPKMTAMTLTATAKGYKDYALRRMPEVFDRPTPWTLSSLSVKPATVNNLNAHVWVKDKAAKGTPAVKYLWPEVHGGGRRLKRFERALKHKGLLPEGYYAVPRRELRLDRYGNISGPMMGKIMSAAQSLAPSFGVGYALNRSALSRKRPGAHNVFIGRPGVNPRAIFNNPTSVHDFLQAIEKYKKAASGSKYSLGMWERTPGHGLIPLLIFTKKKPKYTPRFPFYDWAEEYVNREAPKIFKRIASETLAYHRAR